MRWPRLDVIAATILIGVSMAACRTAAVPTAATTPSATPAEQARADSGRAAYTPADVQFMLGMIAHHAQAVVMSQWAPTHGARPDVRILASRIDVSQRDEIAFMQRWLRDRRETVPDPLAPHHMAGHDSTMAGMTMTGMGGSETLMPGMLTPEQLTQLSAATGPEFDRLFLTFMIQHHQGAITMVDRLFASRGAGRDEFVFRFATDVVSDQTTEIERMRSMLSNTPGHLP